MAVFITPGAVELVAGLLFVVGIVGIAVSPRLSRYASLVVGAGALLATLGVISGWASGVRPSDGRAGWRSLSDLFKSIYDSWPYVFVVAAVATILWTVVSRISAGRWDPRWGVSIAVGSTVAAVLVKLLGSL